MDVRLPDGTVINNVPEGTTKAQLITKLKANGYDVSSLEAVAKPPEVTGEVGFLSPEGIAGIGEIPRGGFGETKTGKTLGYLGEAALNLPESAVAMGGRGYDIAEGLMGLATPEGRAAAGKAIQGIPQAVHKEIMGAVVSPLETAARVKESFRTDPLGTLAGVSALTGGIGALARPGNMLARISQATNPLALPEMAARGVTGGFGQFVSPIITQAGAERKAAGKLYESVMGQPEDVMSALRQEPRSIIGEVPSSQRLAERNLYEPKLATLEADLATGETEVGRQYLIREQQRLAAIQQQLHAIDQQVLQQGRAMTPQAQAELSAVRNDLLRQESALRGQLETAAQRTGERIPAVGQRAPGEAIAERAATLKENFQRQIVKPAYEKAFNLAGKGSKIDISSVLDEAARILGRPISFFDVSTEPQIARRLSKIERKPIPGEFVPLGEYGGYSLEPSGEFAPTKVNLRTADAIRKAINNEIGAISDLAPDAGIKRSNLMALHNKLDAVIHASDIPDTAKTAYRNALDVYRGPYLSRFKTGVTSDLLRSTKKNQSGIIPSKTVKSFLANEDAASQFATTFGKDPIAREALAQGVRDMARTDSAVVDNAGRVNPEGIDDFIRKHRRQLDIMGIDGEALLAPVRQQAETLRAGIRELDREAVFFRSSTGEALRSGEEFVDAMLKDPAAMQVGLRRLTDAGRAALDRELVMRAIKHLNDRNAQKALEYLADNKTTIRMAVDKSDYDRLVNLAENQKALQEVEKRAAKPDIPLDVDLSNVSVDKLTDLSLAAREIDRIEKASNLTGLRPAEATKKIGTAETETARKTVSGFLNSKLTQMEKILDFAGAQINKKTAAVLADALVNNPAKAADLIEQEAARRAKAAMPKPPETRGKTARRAVISGALTTQNALTPENRNAMARQ